MFAVSDVDCAPAEGVRDFPSTLPMIPVRVGFPPVTVSGILGGKRIVPPVMVVTVTVVVAPVARVLVVRSRVSDLPLHVGVVRTAISAVPEAVRLLLRPGLTELVENVRWRVR